MQMFSLVFKWQHHLPQNVYGVKGCLQPNTFVLSIHPLEVSHLFTRIGFLHKRTSSTLTKKKRREPSVGNSGDIYNWSLSSLSSWASQLPPQPQNWLNCPNTTKSSFNQTNNGIKKWPYVVWCLCNIQYSSLDIDTAPHRWRRLERSPREREGAPELSALRVEGPAPIQVQVPELSALWRLAWSILPGQASSTT